MDGLHWVYVVLAQRNDPLAFSESAPKQFPGTQGISSDGSVFALSFHAKEKRKDTVSIVPVLTTARAAH